MATALLQSALTGRPVNARPAAHRVRGSRRVTVFARERPQIWFPGSQPPEHLDGSTPGDFGFDPLRLSKGSDARWEWFKEAELVNSRWAMMAVVGILYTEAQNIAQPWWDLSNKAIAPLPILALVGVVVFAAIEGSRFKNFQTKGGGNSGLLNAAPFDPLNLRSEDQKEREIKNGRLAMVAFLGFSSQAAVQGKGPLASLSYHLEDPFKRNIFTSKVGNEFAVALVAVSLYPLLIEATKTLQGRDKVRV